MAPCVVILAAGIGRRFGGGKQLVPVGPGGQTLLEYSVYDARRAGFGRVVFVIRPDIEAEFRAAVVDRLGHRVETACVFQTLEALPAGRRPPAGRTKPWGTGHAVLVAQEAVAGPFAVANADDFYGARAWEQMGAFLRQPPAGGVPTWALAGYALRATLPPSGAVSRGLCACTPDGWLRDIVETSGIERDGDGARCRAADGTVRVLSGEQAVSMNLWGFTADFFDELRRAFAAFLEAHGGSPDAELQLPTVVQQAVRAGRARARVLPATDEWCGLTNPQDAARVAETLGRLTEAGVYPRELWS